MSVVSLHHRHSGRLEVQASNVHGSIVGILDLLLLKCLIGNIFLVFD